MANIPSQDPVISPAAPPVPISNKFQALPVEPARLQSPKSVVRKFFAKFGSLNCRTAADAGKLSDILRIASEAALSVLCLQESRLLGESDCEVSVNGSEWSVFWSGKLRKKEHGVAIAVRKSKYVEILGVERCGPRLIALNQSIEFIST